MIALSDALSAAGFTTSVVPSFSGEDPVLRTPYRVGTAGAAALAALGCAVAELHVLRGGEPQSVAVSLRAAAASLRSARYLRVNGEAPRVWDPLSGFYAVRDGWISLHCNFPNHRDAALGVLAAEPSRDAVRAKAAGWQGEALEDAVHAAGGCAGFVRTEAEWRAHPQARAVASEPVLRITRIGAAPPQPLARHARPLGGVRVLDLTRVLAGPTCARSLAEHGADVLKITAAHLADSAAIELDTGIGKLSARLDLRDENDRSRLQKLIREGDVFSQSYRPGALAALGFSPAALAELRPGIVCASLCAWGASGPWAARRGFDSIVQCVSGMAAASGTPEQPALMPVSAIDYVSGYLMAFGTVVALYRRAREGGSWHVQVALARVGQWIAERGVLPEAEWRRAPLELPDEELAPLLGETDSPAGRIRHLKPVLELSGTPPHWRRPPVPLGTHPPEWPERE
ncbi:MAG TPA: CoA transferase [Burkholderiales bacterium]|nr:CoA transferase [Burkholderiales bacterium]